MILESFKEWMNKTLDIEDVQEAYNSTTGKDVLSYVTVLENVKCAIFLGGSSNSFISSRFKGRVDGVIIVNPKDVASITLSDKQRAEINNVYYKFLQPDDIMFQGEVISIPIVKEGT